MFKRLISCLIIVSMLWSDIAAAMNDEGEVKSASSGSASLVIKGTNPHSKNDTTEGSPLLKGERQDLYRTITPMTEIASVHHPINESRGSSSDEEGKRGTVSRVRDPVPETKKCPSCWPCKKKKEQEIFIISSDSEDEKYSVDSRTFDEEEKKCCSWLSCRSCSKKKVEDVESSSASKTCCWPLSCCKKRSSGELSREHDYLLIIESEPSLRDLKKQVLLRLVIPLEEDRSTDVIGLEEQSLEEQEVLFQKAQFLYSKIKGTSLEDFGRWFQGHVVENRWRWQDWGGLFIALCMAAGTGSAMSDIVEYSIYNSFFAHHIKQYMPIVMPLARYINISTALTAFVDSTTFMPEATAPSTRAFTMPKSAKEKRYDRSLISLAAISGIYLLLLHFIVTQDQKKFNGETGWWNSPDQVLYFSSLGFFPYLVAQTWKGMRAAVSRVFHPTVPEHVKDRVLALRQLDARLDQLSDSKIQNLHDLFTNPLYAPNSKFKAWALYLCQGEVEDRSKLEGVLSYLALTHYAQESVTEDVELEMGGSSKKTVKAARILAALGLPAGFSLVAVSVFGLFSAFMGWKGALALSITAAALGFVPEAFLQSHNVKETLDDITAKEYGPKRGWKESFKDPYWWGAGAAKVVGIAWAFFQNALTNLAPIFVSLVMLIPAYLGGSDATQEAITGVMIGLAVPYMISELLSGTHDMWGHAVSLAGTVRDFCYGVYDRIVKWCTQKDPISPTQKKQEIRRILTKTIEKTLLLTPQHVKELNRFKLQLEGKEAF